MMRLLRWLLISAALLTLVLLAAGQAGFLEGKPPAGLGVTNGQLAAPSSNPNSVSSQADLFPGHPQLAYARIAPLRYAGDGVQAMQRLAVLIQATERTSILVQRTDYIHAQFQTPILHFMDDVEFLLDSSAGIIHVRSASRLGKSDLGANRARVENLRARYAE